MSSAVVLAPLIGVTLTCLVLGVARACYYRAQHGPALASAVRPRAPSPLSLSQAERQAIRDLLHTPQYADASPRTVYAQLLDAGCYLCSVSSLYRILRADGEAQGRRNQRTHPVYTKPELLATGACQVWSWDISKLKGPGKWEHFHLYVILDVFSRYVVGWMLAARESADLAKALITTCCERESIEPGTLTLHADRGTSMRSKPVALLLSDLGVARSHSRPHVSDDNPYSEAQFKTLKYQPDFPQRFASIEHARAFCATFFAWYNNEHRHSGIGYMTPQDMHSGRAPEIFVARQGVLDRAFELHPERFKARRPQPPALPTQAGINWPKPLPAATATTPN
jgi:putative transposase